MILRAASGDAPIDTDWITTVSNASRHTGERMRILCIVINSSNCFKSHNNADTGSQSGCRGRRRGLQFHTSTISRKNRLSELDVGDATTRLSLPGFSIQPEDGRHSRFLNVSGRKCWDRCHCCVAHRLNTGRSSRRPIWNISSPETGYWFGLKLRVQLKPQISIFRSP
jgi:hypothetical protein